jgi:hypothetical protein
LPSCKSTILVFSSLLSIAHCILDIKLCQFLIKNITTVLFRPTCTKQPWINLSGLWEKHFLIMNVCNAEVLRCSNNITEEKYFGQELILEK